MSFTSMFINFCFHSFDQVPLLIFEGIEEFFPLITDRLDEFLGQAADENFTYDIENPQHQLLMSVGQYFSHFINKVVK